MMPEKTPAVTPALHPTCLRHCTILLLQLRILLRATADQNLPENTRLHQVTAYANKIET
jgi:hypothetical protein